MRLAEERASGASIVPLGGVGQARDDREIAPVDAVLRELRGEPFMGDVGLGDDQQPGRILVDPVDDPRPRHPADAAEPPGAMVEQGIDQSAVEIARRGMDDHARRLVDDQQMIVLEDDLERDVLRLVMRRLRLGDGDLDRSPASAFTAGSRTGAPCGPRTAAAADQRLQPLARQGRHGGGQRPVEPPAGGVLGDPGDDDGMSPRH